MRSQRKGPKTSGRSLALWGSDMPVYTEGFHSNPLTFDPLTLDATFGEALGSTIANEWQNTPVMSINRMASINAAAGKTAGITGFEQTDIVNDAFDAVMTSSWAGGIAHAIIDYESAEERYEKAKQTPYWMSRSEVDRVARDRGFSANELGVSDHGASSIVLGIILEAKEEERARAKVIDNYKSGVVSDLGLFGAGIITQALDPVNLAMSYVPVVSSAKYASALKSATSMGSRALVRARAGAIEGAVGALLVEPLISVAAQQEQLDYGMYDSLMNVGFGGIIGAGLHAGAGAIGDVLAKRISEIEKGKSVDDIISSAQPVGYNAKMLNELSGETRNYAAIAAAIDAENGRRIMSPDEVIKADHAYKPKTSIDVESVPDTMKFGVDDSGAISVVRNAESLAHVIEQDRAKHTTAKDVIDSDLPPVEQARAKVDALISALDKAGETPSGVPYNASGKTILNAMDELGGIQGKSQLPNDKSGKRQANRYDQMPNTYARNLRKGKGGLSLDDMAVRLRDDYGIGDGTYDTMARLMHDDVAERAASRVALGEAYAQQKVLSGEYGVIIERSIASADAVAQAEPVRTLDQVASDAFDYANGVNAVDNQYFYDDTAYKAMEETSSVEISEHYEKLLDETDELMARLEEAADADPMLAEMIEELKTTNAHELRIAEGYERMANCVIGV